MRLLEKIFLISAVKIIMEMYFQILLCIEKRKQESGVGRQRRKGRQAKEL